MDYSTICKKHIHRELNKIKPHDHGCIIYETEAEWQQMVIPFIVQGIQNGDKCIYVLSKRKRNYIRNCLRQEGVDVNEITGSGQLLFIRPADIFKGNNINSIEQVTKIYMRWLDLFLHEGYRTIRVISEEMFRLFDSKQNEFLELQLWLNEEIFTGYPLISLCQYHRHHENPMVLRDAIISCKWLVRNGQVNRNPFCLSAELYYRHKDTSWEAEYMLQAQDTLAESEEKYRLMVEHSLDLILIIEAKTFEILFVSPSQYSILGYYEDELIGRNAISFVHPLYRETSVSLLQKGFHRGSGEGIYPVRKKNGSYIWMETKGTVLRHESQNDKIILFSRDIHEKMLAKKELQESQQKYKYQVDYLNTLINTMNEFCITYDKKTRITFVNKRLLEALGYTEEEMLGKSVLHFVSKDYIEPALNQINNRLYFGEVSSHENAIVCKDGSVLLVRLKGSPIIKNDEIVGGLVLAEDITQERRIEKEMARLVQLNTVGEIAASIGHEIRNPMTTVQGFLQIMSQNEKLSDFRDHFELMLEELNRANSIITEFLALAKDKVVDLQCWNLNKIIAAIAPLLKADAMKEDKNICFELGDIPDLLLDEKEIRQLLLNLVRNGLEAMQEGGTVTVRTCLEEEKVMLVVVDEGEGIPSEILDKIGTPFLSTKEKGTGLGLAVCHSIVTRHNGVINVSTSSQGSKFVICFTPSF